MAYNIIVSPRAQKEIENAIDFYALYSPNAPRNFIASLADAYKTLESSPLFKIRYKTIRAFKLKKFPYSLFFVVNEPQKKVRILSCFHNKRNPNKRPFIWFAYRLFKKAYSDTFDIKFYQTFSLL